MEDFTYVQNQFRTLAFIASSDPYQEICDNYQDYIIRLNRYKKEDKLYEANQVIIDMLRSGFSNCCIWDSSTINNHFVRVSNTFTNLKDVHLKDYVE